MNLGQRALLKAAFERWMRALTTSNGSAPSIKTTLPSLRWATPWASRSRALMDNQSSGNAGVGSVESVMPALSQVEPGAQAGA